VSRVRGALIGLLALLCGCETQRLIVIDAVGPAHAMSAPAPRAGTLIVYSVLESASVEQSEYPVHSPYTLLTDEGRLLLHVGNRTGAFAANPQALSLAAGRYRVRALAPGGGEVIVPVIIESDQTTVVRLDGSALAQRSAESATLVRLPDGQVVGYRAP